MRQVWRRLLEILFSPEFEAALWAKLVGCGLGHLGYPLGRSHPFPLFDLRPTCRNQDIPSKLRVRRRELRILIDKKGYTNGRVHTDTGMFRSPFRKLAALSVNLDQPAQRRRSKARHNAALLGQRYCDNVGLWDVLSQQGSVQSKGPLPGGSGPRPGTRRRG